MINYNSKEKELTVETMFVAQNSGDINIQIQLDEVLENCNYFLEYSCPKYNKYCSCVLSIEDKILDIKLPSLLTKFVGEVYVQLVMRNQSNGEIIDKSMISQDPLLIVKNSINANIEVNDDQEETLIGQIVELLNNFEVIKSDIEKQLQEKLNNSEYDSFLVEYNRQIEEIKGILTSNDVEYDTLQELVDTLKNNKEGITNLETQISKKADKTLLNDYAKKSYIGQILTFDYTNIQINRIDDSMIFDTKEKVANHFGGVWENFSPGRVLIGQGLCEDINYTVGQESGSSKHILSVNEIPKHYHKTYSLYSPDNKPGGMTGRQLASSTNDGQTWFGYDTSEVGENMPHNNMQPYRVVYMYRRLS